VRILVVEDDQSILDFLCKGLRAECFEVDAAEDGEKASFLARNNDYDLVILDNILPGKSGPDICREIRERGKSMPVLVLSVQSELPTKVELFNIGADDYVTKPFSFEELLARVRALLRRPALMQSNTLQLHDLTLDPTRHHVTRAGRELQLTRKEFELLEYLMRHPGRVLSRTVILEHVWDVNSDPFSNTLETHVLNLRRKVDRGAPLRLIHTISGYGYKIDTVK
jgi:DNA-binding response OmpR family regulator